MRNHHYALYDSKPPVITQRDREIIMSLSDDEIPDTRPSFWNNEKQLFADLIRDTIHQYRKHLPRVGRNLESRKIVSEIESWLLSEYEYPSAFGHVCDMLDLDMSAVRRAFRRIHDESLLGKRDQGDSHYRRFKL